MGAVTLFQSPFLGVAQKLLVLPLKLHVHQSHDAGCNRWTTPSALFTRFRHHFYYFPSVMYFSPLPSEIIENVKLIHKPVSLQPRGLINKGNWCYINAVSFFPGFSSSRLWVDQAPLVYFFLSFNSALQTLQALIACPPMYHLMKSIPLFSEVQRPCTSTPMMDNL